MGERGNLFLLFLFFLRKIISFIKISYPSLKKKLVNIPILDNIKERRLASFLLCGINKKFYGDIKKAFHDISVSPGKSFLFFLTD